MYLCKLHVLWKEVMLLLNSKCSMMSESSSQNSHDVVAKLHEMRYILIHKYFIAMRASSTTFLSFFMPCYCTLPYFFLWEEQQEGKWKICRRRSVFLSSCVHANWSRMRLNPIRFSPSLKWKSFYCLVLREKKELQITKKNVEQISIWICILKWIRL